MCALQTFIIIIIIIVFKGRIHVIKRRGHAPPSTNVLVLGQCFPPTKGVRQGRLGVSEAGAGELWVRSKFSEMG